MILVTGGTGLVGAHLLYHLTKNGERVRALYRDVRKLGQVKQVFATYTKDYTKLYNAIDWVKADLLDITSLTKAFNGISYVYHCAALVSFDPRKYHLLRRTNIEGTANIVNFCIDHNIKKICYMSSVATLSLPLNQNAITEESHWNPEEENSVYGITKYGAEMEVWRGSQEGLNTIIVNPGIILGAGIWHDGSGSIFMRAHKGINFYTKGSTGLVTVEDVVHIMIALMKSNIHSERFILVSENWPYKKFLRSISTAVNKKPPQKEVSSFVLNLMWKLDWLYCKLTGKPRQLTKHVAKALLTEKYFSNEKIKQALGYKFKPIDKSITQLGKLYLKQVQ